jgi:hypothetical protein
LTIARSNNKKSSIASAFSNLEGIAYERGDFKKALELLDSSFKYTDDNDFGTLGTNYMIKQIC